MPTNPYISNYQVSGEQQLVDDLVIESIKFWGVDLFYCPRTINSLDQLDQTDDQSAFNTQYRIEMYIKNVDGFTGDGRFLSKFNIEIRDEITFTVARRTYEKEVAQGGTPNRPNEGDIIFFPINKKIYRVKYVQHESTFYQLGALYVYDLVCEQFEYSNEVLNTGIPEIDKLQGEFTLNMDVFGYYTEDIPPYVLRDEDGYILVDESFMLDKQTEPAENDFNTEQVANGIINFTETNPFGEDDLQTPRDN